MRASGWLACRHHQKVKMQANFNEELNKIKTAQYIRVLRTAASAEALAKPNKKWVISDVEHEIILTETLKPFRSE